MRTKLVLGTVLTLLVLAGHAYATRRGTLLGLMMGGKQSSTTPAVTCTNCTAPQLNMIVRNLLYNGWEMFPDFIADDLGCSNSFFPVCEIGGSVNNQWGWQSVGYPEMEIAYCDGLYHLCQQGILGGDYSPTGFPLVCVGGVFTGSYSLTNISFDGYSDVTNSVDIEFRSAADITNNCIACVGVSQGTVTPSSLGGELPCDLVFTSTGCNGFDWTWANDGGSITVHRTETNTWKIANTCSGGPNVETNSLTCVSGVLTGTVWAGGKSYTFNPP
jgi:hypothetical protein